MPEGRIKTIKKSSLSYLVWGALVIASLGAFTFEAEQRFDDFRTLWHDYNADARLFDSKLERLQAEIGYGGFIHHFKNMVLRQDEKYAQNAEKKLENAFHTISSLRSHNLSFEEEKALKDLEQVFSEYRDNFNKLQSMLNAGYGAEQIDKIAKVDDTPAFQALDYLRSINTLKDRKFTISSNSKFLDASTFLQAGFIILGTACFFIFLLLRSNHNQLHNIQQTSNQLKSFIEAAPEAIMVINDRGIIDLVNPQICLLLGYEKDQMETHSIDDIFTGKLQKLHQRLNQTFLSKNNPGKQWQRTIKLHTKDGDKFDGEVTISRTSINSKKVIIATIRDITTHVKKHKELTEQAHYFEEMSARDALTGCLNRRGFYLRSQQSLDTIDECACISLDIDFFKAINDTYGHAIGDKVLIEYSHRIQNALRGHDIFGRVGGEEFIILLPDSSLENACEVAERLRLNIEQAPFEFNDDAITITTSAGVCIYKPEDDLDSLIARSDKALYEAKENGRNRVMTA